MKKILFGLIGLSAFVFADELNMNAEPNPNSNVFSQVQEGMMIVNGSITHTPPTIKYVIYSATTDTDTVTDWDSALQLPTFTISTDAETSKFDDSVAIPKVYVRKVTGSSSAVKITAAPVQFRIQVDSGYTTLNTSLENWSPTYTATISPFAFIPKAALTELLQRQDIPGMQVNTNGEVLGTGGAYKYGKGIKFQAADGVLTISTGDGSTQTAFDEEKVLRVNNAFASEVESQNVKVYARII